jgi:hypothetical protein
MSKRIHPIIAALFTGPGRSQPVAFEWRLISRHGRPFLLLPRGLAATRTGLCLYSAQRLRAKIYRKIVPTLLQSPLARFFERIQFQADASADILQFMAQQVGIPAERIYPPAIKLSGVDSRCRLVLLLCDESGRPARVIKAGLNEAGRRATDQEADFLAQLPANKLGCIRLTGRLATPAISAFATDYFPGTSPYDDAGLEHLFHDWLNPGEPVPLESLPAWRDLAAAILARRHAPERAAAEVEQLVNSPRFQKYAAAAGIGGIVEPLVLSYLLHHLRVIRPLEGGATTARLFEFLSGYWQMKPLPAPADARPAEPSAPPGVWATARRQLNAAAGHAFNLFWEPNLNFHDRPSLAAKILFHWRGILFSGGLLAALGVGQFFAGVTVSLMPLYVAVCVLLAWKTDRRIGTLMAVVAAMVSPLVVGMKNADYASLQVISWNSAMSFIILETGVLFAIRIREQNNLFHPPAAAAPSPAKIADHWAVLLACGIWFAAAAALDWATGPHLTCRPLYLFPCMMVTLVFNLHWGVVAAALAAFTDTVLQSCADARFQAPQIFGWNLLMRFTLFLLVIVLLDRIRRDSILFSARK